MSDPVQPDPDVRRPATIRDVAERAGVSQAAVSKVIRNAYGVSDAMRSRVSAAIDELAYRPRVAARAMRGSTSTIGVQLPQLDNGFFTRILDGVVRALNASDYHMIIAPMSDPVSGTAAIESLFDRQVDGIIAVAPGVPQQWLEDMGRRVPLVQVGQHDDPVNYDVVVGDDEAGTRLVMEHLFALGHRKIAHVTNDERILLEPRTDPHPRRLHVYEQMMREHGLTPQVFRLPRSDVDGYQATTRLLDQADPPTAVFAGHDALALSALRAVAEHGLSPRQLAVVGYDDIPLADHPLIGLTTVDQMGEEMGATAAELLIGRIDGRTQPERRVFDPQLRVRRSSTGL